MTTNWRDIMTPGPGAYPEGFHDPEIINPEGLAAALSEDEAQDQGEDGMYDEESDFIGEDPDSLDASSSEHWYSPPPHTAEAVYVEDEDDEGPGDDEEGIDADEAARREAAEETAQAEPVAPASLDFVLDPSGQLRMRLCVGGQCYTKLCSLEMSKLVATARRLSDKAQAGQLTAGDLMGAQVDLVGAPNKTLQNQNDRMIANGYTWVSSTGSGSYTIAMPDRTTKVMKYVSQFNDDGRGGKYPSGWGHWEQSKGSQIQGINAVMGPVEQAREAQMKAASAMAKLQQLQQTAMMQQQAAAAQQQLADWQAQQAGGGAAGAAMGTIDPYGGYGYDPYGGYGYDPSQGYGYDPSQGYGYDPSQGYGGGY